VIFLNKELRLEKAKGDWVFFIDADERVSSALWFEIMQHTNESFEIFDGFYIRRQDTMWGKVLKHGETGNIILLPFGKKKSGKMEGKVHEQWKVLGKTMVLKILLIIFPIVQLLIFLKK